MNKSYKDNNYYVAWTCIHIEAHTSPVTDETKASANPASEASIPGVRRTTTPVIPTMAALVRLNRTDSHRLTPHLRT